METVVMPSLTEELIYTEKTRESALNLKARELKIGRSTKDLCVPRTGRKATLNF